MSKITNNETALALLIEARKHPRIKAVSAVVTELLADLEKSILKDGTSTVFHAHVKENSENFTQNRQAVLVELKDRGFDVAYNEHEGCIVFWFDIESKE